jgi:hypothetical protein
MRRRKKLRRGMNLYCQFPRGTNDQDGHPGVFPASNVGAETGQGILQSGDQKSQRLSRAGSCACQYVATRDGGGVGLSLYFCGVDMAQFVCYCVEGGGVKWRVERRERGWSRRR